MKSIFQSKTVWFICATLINTVAPIAQTTLSESRLPNAAEFLQVAIGLTSAVGGIVGRYQASSLVYTPDWMAGRSAPRS